MKLVDQLCAPATVALTPAQITALLPEVPGWSLIDARLCRRFALTDYRETIAFVNALAWMIHQQDHHPELVLNYKTCDVAFNTHSVGGGISQNDFICAALANTIYDQRTGA